MSLLKRRGFRVEDFSAVHPGGRLGRRLRRVSELMHSGDAMPKVSPRTLVPGVITEMTAGRLGMTVVVGDDGKLAGVLTDGDLRRLLQGQLPDKGKKADILSHSAQEFMTSHPRTIPPDALATEALRLMEKHRITSLVVVDSENHPLGTVHLHDLWRTELI